jgi:type VI secretion system secreted protein VgrG
MDDKAGKEEMFINASRDASISAGNNATESVGQQRDALDRREPLRSRSQTACLSSVGANQTLLVGGSQTIHVAHVHGRRRRQPRAARSGQSRPQGRRRSQRTVTGASTLTIGGLQVDLVAGSADDEGMATMDDTVGAALVEMTASSRTVTVKGARTESAGAAKVILAKGGRAVQVTGTLKQKVAGAILTKISSDRTDASTAELLDVAGGAQIVKATNVVFQAKSLLSVVMGGATLTMTPSSVTIAGAKITIDGECDETAALIKDN